MLMWYYESEEYIVIYQRDPMSEIQTIYEGEDRKNAVDAIKDFIEEWDGDHGGYSDNNIMFEGEPRQ